MQNTNYNFSLSIKILKIVKYARKYAHISVYALYARSKIIL